jgi:mono/diheme cytochrome c family protein
VIVRSVAALVLLAVALAACGGSSVSDEFKEGRTIYGDYCAVCHGSAGQGGVGPALDEVLSTWPSCDQQVEWVSIGSERWRAQYGETYGANDSPITAVMPQHDDRLTLDEIRRVSAFERIQYGGQEEADAFADCEVG